MNLRNAHGAAQHHRLDATGRSSGIVQLIAAMGLSGTIGLFVLKSSASPVTAAWSRCAVGAIAMLGLCWARGYLTSSGYTRKLAVVASLGGLALVTNWVLLFAAYKNTSIGIATTTYHLQPFMLILAAPIVTRERITRRQVAWVALGFSGLVLIARPWHESPGGHYLLGVGEAVLAAALYAVATLVAKQLTGVRPHITVLVQATVGAIVLGPFVAWGSFGHVVVHGWLWLAGLGVIHTCLMYVLMYSAYPKLETVTIAVLGFIYPVVALVVDMLAFGTRLDLAQAIGISAILTAGIANARTRMS